MGKKAELVGSHFPTIYLTVMSLLLGIALSQLIPIVIKYLEIAEYPFSDIHVVPLLLMLLIIFTVWHHYAIGIFFLRWFPNIIDTIIPFVVSIGQFILISYLVIDTSVSDIDIVSWTKGFAIFLIVGSPGYFAAAWRIDPDSFTNIMTRIDAVTHCNNVRKYYNLSGIFVLIQGLFALWINIFQFEPLLWVSLILFLGHLISSEYFLIHTIKPHFIKAIDKDD